MAARHAAARGLIANARMLQSVDGTAEIQKVVIARALDRRARDL